MDNLFENALFVQAIGNFLHETRIRKDIPIKILVAGICTGRDLHRIEIGDRKTLDIHQVALLFERLGLTLESGIKQILDGLNSNFSAVLKLFFLLDDCDFAGAKQFTAMPYVQKIFDQNKKLRTYYLCAKLLLEKKCQDVITILPDFSLKSDEIPSILDVLLLNCYCLAYLQINIENDDLEEKMKKKFQEFQKLTIWFVDYYPDIMIRMIVNIADYYRIIGYIKYSKSLLDFALKKCFEKRLYDSIIDVNLCKLVICIQYENGVDAELLFEDIEANLRTIKKPYRECIIREKITNLNKLHNKYCLEAQK